jgi:RNA polymerase sigma-70 factor, ECF subfamily
MAFDALRGQYGYRHPRGARSGRTMDTRLVIRAQRGDEAAFAAITESAYVRLRRVAYRILRDPDLAEDATQSALVGIWRKLPRLRDPARFDAWSYRFLVNACADEARRRNRSVTEVRVGAEPVAPDGTSMIDDRDQLERGFRCLSVDQRAVIVLRHYLDLTLDDTATALGVPVGTVNSRLSRAMAKLRSAMGPDESGPRSTQLEAAR